MIRAQPPSIWAWPLFGPACLESQPKHSTYDANTKQVQWALSDLINWVGWAGWSPHTRLIGRATVLAAEPRALTNRSSLSAHPPIATLHVAILTWLPSTGTPAASPRSFNAGLPFTELSSATRSPLFQIAPLVAQDIADFPRRNRAGNGGPRRRRLGSEARPGTRVLRRGNLVGLHHPGRPPGDSVSFPSPTRFSRFAPLGFFFERYRVLDRLLGFLMWPCFRDQIHKAIWTGWEEVRSPRIPQFCAERGLLRVVFYK